MRQFFILWCLSLMPLMLSSFSGKKNVNEPQVIMVPSVTLEQTCGDRISDNMVYLSSDNYNLIVKFGETSSFRIDWNSGERVYYPKGTTKVPIYADRFTISVPGDSSVNLKFYCFVIHRS